MNLSTGTCCHRCGGETEISFETSLKRHRSNLPASCGSRRAGERVGEHVAAVLTDVELDVGSGAAGTVLRHDTSAIVEVELYAVEGSAVK